ncbi:hypothetical protein KBD45_07275 [Candidatus Dojkabacteria bacterium]|nr:hypothetical protein [Candidatus Dojkabacteria bacterium]
MVPEVVLNSIEFQDLQDAHRFYLLSLGSNQPPSLFGWINFADNIPVSKLAVICALLPREFELLLQFGRFPIVDPLKPVNNTSPPEVNQSGFTASAARNDPFEDFLKNAAIPDKKRFVDALAEWVLSPNGPRPNYQNFHFQQAVLSPTSNTPNQVAWYEKPYSTEEQLIQDMHQQILELVNQCSRATQNDRLLEGFLRNSLLNGKLGLCIAEYEKHQQQRGYSFDRFSLNWFQLADTFIQVWFLPAAKRVYKVPSQENISNAQRLASPLILALRSALNQRILTQ